MSVRLTEFIRKQILEAVLKHAFDVPEKELKEGQHALGDAVYKDVYPAKVREQMAALPEGFLPTEGHIRVQFDGSGSRGFTAVYFGEERRIAKDHDRYSAAKVYPAKHAFSAHFDKLKRAEENLKGLKDTAKASAKSVLESVTTVKRLIEVWPEVEQFARPYAEEAPTRAIALPIQELNRSLGLPPKAARRTGGAK